MRLDLAYDGSGFHGFARQLHLRTVQGVLEDALGRLFQTAITTTCAGRTDAGVHATAQVVHCDVPIERTTDLSRVRRALDRLCGDDIAIWSATVVEDDFDARFSALARHYRYRLCDAPAADPLERHRTWHVGPPALDVAAMQGAGSHLVGTHDFSSFCRRAEPAQRLVRRIDHLDVTRAGDLVCIDVDGPAFCHQLVRSVTGLLVRVGRGRIGADEVPDVIGARDRTRVGAVAPPHGLTLTAVRYPAG